ncbi:Lycopene elongase [Grifola frondosa]|uniref:Lycopene elongase n=1 Tax=Grifola frondosa TaxID=5627 RepID=A0A1C7MDK4_GRIFR|nr:Lycopene elongase [Grifola frondosa]
MRSFSVVFGINDVYDYASDVRNPRKTADGLEGTVLSPEYHSHVIKAAWISTFVIFLSSLLTRRVQNICATTLLLFLSWQYSAPPLRLKEFPVMDSLSNGCIIFLAWFMGYSSMGGVIVRAPSKGYVLSLCTAGVHALGAVVDAEFDAAAGQRTIATALGRRPAALLAALAYLAAFIAEGTLSIFGVYILGGFVGMLVASVNLEQAHVAFQLIICWTVAMSM